MKPISRALFAYGAFLILAGLAGYLSNPEKARTALLSGGTFGALNLGLGWLALRGWRPSVRVALGTAGFLGAVFVWRASASWLAVAGGQPEKRVAAGIITAMLVGTILLLFSLVRAERRARASAR